MDVSQITELVGTLVGLGLGIPIIVQYVAQVSNKMTLDHSNTINQAALSDQSGTARAEVLGKTT